MEKCVKKSFTDFDYCLGISLPLIRLRELLTPAHLLFQSNKRVPHNNIEHELLRVGWSYKLNTIF